MTHARLAFQEGERIAKISFFTLVGIGAAEILIGLLSNSVTISTDGVDSMSDAAISLIVWAGLRISKKAPDEKFHFGYLKVETFAALLASIGMIIMATVFVYFAYLRLLEPETVSYVPLVLLTLLGAGLVSLYRALEMRRVAKRHNLLALKTDATNSIKDASASFIGVGTIAGVALGFPFMDALGGLIIAIYIYSVAYISLREASLVLLDAFQSPEVVDKVKEVIESRQGIKVESVRLRRSGPLIVGVIHVLADGSLTLDEVGRIRTHIKADLGREIDGLGGLSLLFHTKNERDVLE